MTEFRPGRFEILPVIIKNLLIILTIIAMILTNKHKITNNGLKLVSILLNGNGLLDEPSSTSFIPVNVL